MRVIAVLSTFAVSAIAFKFKAAVPHDSKGKPVSHGFPKDNLKLTVGPVTVDVNLGTGSKSGKVGKQRLANDYYEPSTDELAAIAHQFDGYLPAHAKTSKASSAALLNGVVAIFNIEQNATGDRNMGWIRLALSQYATTGLTTDQSQVAFVSLPNSNPKPHFDLGIANASDPFLAVIQGFSGSNWGPGNPGYGSMTVVQHSTYPASNIHNPTNLPSESVIWTIDTSSQLTATWFNDNGTPVPATIYFDNRYGDFGFTGDLQQYVNLYLDQVTRVSLYFIPLY